MILTKGTQRLPMYDELKKHEPILVITDCRDERIPMSEKAERTKVTIKPGDCGEMGYEYASWLSLLISLSKHASTGKNEIFLYVGGLYVGDMSYREIHVALSLIYT